MVKQLFRFYQINTFLWCKFTLKFFTLYLIEKKKTGKPEDKGGQRTGYPNLHSVSGHILNLMATSPLAAYIFKMYKLNLKNNDDQSFGKHFLKVIELRPLKTAAYVAHEWDTNLWVFNNEPPLTYRVVCDTAYEPVF